MPKKLERKWFRASVDTIRGFGLGFSTKIFYVFQTTERNARKRIREIVGDSLYDLGYCGNRGINGLEVWK